MVELFNSESLLKVDDVADRLQVSIATVRDWVFYRKIPFIKLGEGKRSLVRFEGRLLNLWLESNRNDDNNRDIPEGKSRKVRKASKQTVDEFNKFVENLKQQH